MSVAANVISAVIKSVVGDKVGNELANEVVGISIDGISENGIDKINDFISGKKAKMEHILSKENMRTMNIPESAIDHVVEEIKDLFKSIDITDEVFRQCKYDSMNLRDFLWNEYCIYKGNGYIECESEIKRSLFTVAEVLIELVRESETFQQDVSIHISNSVDDIMEGEQKNFGNITERFDKLEEKVLEIYSKLSENFSQNIYTKEQIRNSEKDFIKLEANIDELLQDKFDELFSGEERNSDIEEVGENSIQKMLYKIMGKNLVNFWGENSDKYLQDLEIKWDNEEESKENELENNDLDKRLYIGEWLDPIHKFSGSEGKYFSIVDHFNIFTLIYMVKKKINPQTNEWWFELEYLEYSEDKQDEWNVTRTYFVDNPSSEGNPLVFLSFIDGNECISINIGFLDYEDIRISKKPAFMKFKQSWIQTDKMRKIIRFRANYQTSIVIIDPEFHIPIEPKEIYNEEKMRYELYIDLQAKKKYFACQVRFKLKENGILEKTRKASPHMLGYNYYIGQYGLKQNWLKAAEWLMQSDKPEDAYYLGVIFMKDTLLHDVSLARQYLTKASELGIEMAYELLKEL